jgi:hypothetical protein
MCDSRRYRSNAAECLLASYEARQPCYGKLNFSVTALWLALAGHDEAIDNLLASWDMAEPVKTDGFVLLSPPMPPAFLQHLQFPHSRVASGLTHGAASERSGTC